MRRGGFYTITMKPTNKTFYIALFLTAVTAAVVAIGLNLLWFGIYEWMKQSLGLSYPRAAICLGGITWFTVMSRFIAKGGTDIDRYIS